MRKRIFLDWNRLFGALSAVCLLGAPMFALGETDAGSRGSSSRPASAPAQEGDGAIPREFSLPPEASEPRLGASGVALDELRKSAGPRIEVKVTEVRTATPPVPGATLVLEADRRLRDGTSFQWLQVGGPPVEIKDPSQPTIQVKIPGGATRLGFVLVAARPELTIVNKVNIPIQSTAGELGPAPTEWGPRRTGKIQADAGDDQVGLVGHRVTLNGSRSRPADGKTARWLQIGGPPIVGPQQQGAFFSFVPGSPGLYRFMLVVAGGDEAPETDDVSVLVGSPPSGAGIAAPSATPVAVAAPISTPQPAQTPEQALSATLSRLSNGRALAGQVADALEAVSERASLYTSFAELQQELARRLEVVIPLEPVQRAAWNQGIFAPLTTYTVSQLLAAGLDVRRPKDFSSRFPPLSASGSTTISSPWRRCFAPPRQSAEGC